MAFAKGVERVGCLLSQEAQHPLAATRKANCCSACVPALMVLQNQGLSTSRWWSALAAGLALPLF
jgi:hypothetical protein